MVNNMDNINRNADTERRITTDTLLSYWKEQLPPLVDYAELVGAPDWAYGCKMVYEDEYGYIVEATIKALEKYKEFSDIIDKFNSVPEKYLVPHGLRAEMNMYDDAASIYKYIVNISESEYYSFHYDMKHYDYDDLMYNQLHNLNVEENDIIRLYVPERDLYRDIKITEIEYGDGTIWFDIIGDNE